MEMSNKRSMHSFFSLMLENSDCTGKVKACVSLTFSKRWKCFLANACVRTYTHTYDLWLIWQSAEFSSVPSAFLFCGLFLLRLSFQSWKEANEKKKLGWIPSHYGVSSQKQDFLVNPNHSVHLSDIDTSS